LLSVRDGAALSHWSAAALRGMWTPAPAVVDVTVDDAPAAVNPGVRVHRGRILQSHDVWIRKALPVTSPARTPLDVAALATDRQLEIAFDRGLVERTLKRSHVHDVLDRAGGHCGRGRLAALVEQELGASTLTPTPSTPPATASNAIAAKTTSYDAPTSTSCASSTERSPRALTASSPTSPEN
jgi:hypothetical protein